MESRCGGRRIGAAVAGLRGAVDVEVLHHVQPRGARVVAGHLVAEVAHAGEGLSWAAELDAAAPPL